MAALNDAILQKVGDLYQYFIVSPSEVREDMKKHLEAALKEYED